jgi:hypothetical protein
LNANEPEVDTYISGLSTPLSAGQITKLNTFVSSLKTGLSISALSDAFDVMYILGGETAESSLKNLVKNAHHAQSVNSPAFVEFEGYTGNGISSYLNTNYNPATQAVNYKQNDAGVGVYARTATSGAIMSIFGACNPSGIGLHLTPQISSSGRAFWSIHTDGSSLNSMFTIGGDIGLLSLHRPDSGNAYVFKNNTQISTKAQASTSIHSNNIFVLARNIDGTPSTYTSNQVSFFFVGKSFKDTILVITNAIEAYMDSNGKGVIA